MSGGVATRVSIPDNVKSTIQNIREITKKLHSDDEIYAVLKECSMDPNETAQKLMYLDTFHEVKKRRDRKKESLKGRASEESRTAPGGHRRMVRGGGQGNSSDAGGGRNSSARRENGGGHVPDEGSLSSFMSVQQKTKNNAAVPSTKASIGVPNGVKSMSNGTASPVPAPKSSAGVDANKLGATAPRYAVVVASTPVGLKDQHKAPTPTSEQLLNSATSAADTGVCSSASDPIPIPIKENKDVSSDPIVLESSKRADVASKSNNNVIKEKTQSNNAKAIVKNHQSKSSEPPSSIHDGSRAILLPNSDGESQPESTDASKVAAPEVQTIAVEASLPLPLDSSQSDIKLVTFPNHIKVPESLRNALTFGSINSTFGTTVGSVNGTSGNGSTGGVESSQDTDEAAKEPSPSNVSVASSVQGDLSETPLPSANVLEKLQPSEGNVSSIPDSDSKSELLKQGLQLPPEVPHSLTALNGPSYNFGFLPPMLGSQVLQVEGQDNQAHEAPRSSNFGGNSVGVPSPNTTPPLPSSIAATPQIPVFRHAYPANYFPYGYMPPYYLPPMHQFLSPNGYPPQASAYLPPTAPAAAGIKFPPPQLKAGSNAANPAQYNIQSGGSFITTPTGYAPGPAVTSGSSVGNTEDLGASQMKGSHIYTTGQLTEGQTVWFHTPGQDISSLYNLPQGQRFAFSPVHAGHGAMTGIFPPGQTMASPTYLQQSQAVAGAAETIGPPPAAYQQPQHAQMNWNSSF
ncbi:GBF-interacting protein 1-like [Argentina anserina]|uniref:GBF-interacting protein 1-like n=1 Tax=Argentina anserina TaxID=57926 RepID=UPI0021765BA9|nr:GBF-interacting protein 1-like [Potentilla anserina]